MATYTTDQRRRALELYADVGPRAAARETGIPVSTIGTWAADEGRTFGAERTRQATEVRRARIIEKLHAIAELGAEIELDLLEAGEVSLRDVVGARTRAIHDLQLLSGEATTRAETFDRTAAEERLAEVFQAAERRRETRAS